MNEPAAVEQSRWITKTQEDPDHSKSYIERFRTMAADGKDLVGEARLIDAMAPRSARILDAGCGPGRVGGYLHAAGHMVVGVDIDPELIAAAEEDHPGPTWLVQDLALLDLPSQGITEPFQLIVSAGNVMTFLAPSTRRQVLTGFERHLEADGRAVIGFGLARDYEIEDYRADVRSAGLAIEFEFGTWDLRPFTEDADFIVTVVVKD